MSNNSTVDFFGYEENSSADARCVAIADLRGDFRLFFTLLTQITQIASLDEQQRWHWEKDNTTLVVLGNFVDRFGNQGFNRLLFTTEEAIADEVKIIQSLTALEQLARSEDRGNAVVVLMGDHEVANLLHWEDYQNYQMQNPENGRDQEQRKAFVETHLKPLALRHGLVARWGLLGGTVYFSHASLDLSWFQKYQPRSLSALNRSWQRWLGDGNYSRLNWLRDPSSPLLSDFMALKPQIWRENDQEVLIRVLGDDPNPKFVQSGTLPVQDMIAESWDPNLRRLHCKGVNSYTAPTALVSRSPDGEDQLYFLHNGMADVFCTYGETDRRPQALEFFLHLNDNDEALYLDCNLNVMSPEEYRLYMDERPVNSCARNPYDTVSTSPLQLTEEEKTALHKITPPNVQAERLQEDGDIKEVVLVLFSKDLKHVLMLQEQKTQKWTVPRVRRKNNETGWEALKRMLAEEVGMPSLELLPGGEETRFETHTQVWLKRTGQGLSFIPHGVYDDAQWIPYDRLISENLTRQTQLLFCVLMRDGALWHSHSFRECPEWLTSQADVSNRTKVTWWEKDLVNEK